MPVAIDDADMSKPGAIRDMVERVGRSFGPVDILVNNAGIQHVAPIEEFPPEKWDAILAINLSAAFHATRAVLPEMKRRGFGRIVNIASAHGLIASPFKSAYVAAKHGVVGLTKVVALEAAEHRRDLQCGLSGLCLDAAGREADRWSGQGAWHQPRRGDPRGLPGGAADQALCHCRGDRGALWCSCAATPPPRSPVSPCRSTAAGRRTDMGQQTPSRRSRVVSLSSWTPTLGDEGVAASPALAWLRCPHLRCFPLSGNAKKYGNRVQRRHR